MALWFLITHSAMPLRCEKRFDVDTKISNLKDKLYSLCGTMPMYQTILLRNNEGTCLATLDDDEACLKNYPIFEYATLHVVDSDPTNAMARLMDTSQVQRLEMTEEEYDKRESTLLFIFQTIYLSCAQCFLLFDRHLSYVQEDSAEGPCGG
jgi:tubulin-folding cofactor B